MQKFLPIDKSHCIRMALIDLFRLNRDSSYKFENKNISSDLISLKNSIKDWLNNTPIRVGESGTIYRFLKFASWKFGLNKKFILEGTLRNRNICNSPKIVFLPQQKLLLLDNQTSQWASASALLGDKERIKNPPLKLALTYDVLDNWSESWQPIIDKTIQKQAEVFCLIQNGKRHNFKPIHSEDFCFAYVFGFITLEDAAKKWPSLASHESNRLKEIVKCLKQAKNNQVVTTKDHRIIQAIAMWGQCVNKKIKFKHPECVSKSWPLFWEFLKINS